MSLQRKRSLRRERREQRLRTKIRSVSTAPRLSVFRSSKHFYAQIIDDAAGATLVSCSTAVLTDIKGNKKDRAKTVGAQIAQLAQQKGIAKVAFDRGRFLYHGRVKAFADGAREGGLVF